MNNIKRNLPFIKSIFRQANCYKRQEMLRHANKNQINAVSEIVLNLLKKKIPVKPPLMAQLRQHERALCEIGKKKKFHQASKTGVDETKRTWIVDIDEPSTLSMSARTLKSLVGLIQEANAKLNTLEEQHKDLQIRYNRVEQELIHLKFSVLCEDCCKKGEGEVCRQCSIKFEKKNIGSIANIRKAMEEVLMVPPKEMERLVQFYKGESTENALLKKAARMAAKRDVLLKSKLPASIIKAKVKPQHDINYSKAKNIRDKWKADEKMVKAIDRLPGKKKCVGTRVKGHHQSKKTFAFVTFFIVTTFSFF